MRALLIGPENPHFAGHLRTLQTLPEITAITVCCADSGDMALLQAAVASDAPKVLAHFASVNEALAGGHYDFVLGCPRNDRALAVYEAVFAHKLPALAEKPLGRNAAEAAKICEMADASGVTLGVCYQNRYNPVVRYAREFIAAGLLGRLMQVQTRYVTTNIAARDPNHWLFKRECVGGGVLQWLGCHHVDVARHSELVGEVNIAGIARPFAISAAEVSRIAGKYLLAVQEAAKVFQYIAAARPAAPFVTEVSMDETDAPQTPPELLVILAAIADAGIPIQTIAPKFTGRFNKGVDYVGDVVQFEQEFNDDLCVIAHAIQHYGLPDTLKLSVHSGSDKFSIYPAIRRALAKHGCGVHVKTAGTTWLEEVIGLAEHGGVGLALAKEIYAEALAHIDELCAPYAAVIDIDRAKLPTVAVVNGWTSEQFVRALRHNQADALFNISLRQLLHVGFKIAAKMGPRYLNLLEECKESVARNVTTNLFDRHIKPLFL